ncbi:ExbD/TolR family protein [Qipengyuania soli]|nr:biopolymer transporter ExbD [Qipengyuania soli]
MPYTHRRCATTYRPMSELNITPLIDVMLVLLIMFIMVIPIATHSLLIPLPNGPGRFEILEVNTVHIDVSDRVFWNGLELDRQELLNQLASAAKNTDQPLVRFEPDARASYDKSAKTIALIKDSGVRRFAFIGNERYRNFDAE